MSLSDWAARYAAAVSMIALLLRHFSHRKGALKLVMTVNPNMALVGSELPSGTSVTGLSVRHLQGTSTTITPVAVYGYTSRAHKMIVNDRPRLSLGCSRSKVLTQR